MSTPTADRQPSGAERRATLAALASESAAGHRGIALRYPEGSRWIEQDYAALAKTVDELARGLIAAGVQPGDRVGILAQTRVEWTWADLAALSAGAVPVPVYQTNSPAECRYVLEHSGAKLLFCEGGEQLDKIAEIRGDLPALEALVSFTDAREGVLSLEELRARGRDVHADALAERRAGVEPDDLCTIVYTSGTTGDPKGCMITHRNMRAAVDMVRETLDLGEEHTFYVFLPLAHVLTRLVQFVALDAGAGLINWRRDPKLLLEDVQTVRPTHLPSVPRIFEKIHTAATAKAQEAGGIKERMLGWAVGVGRRVDADRRARRTPGIALRAQHALADRLVLHKIRDLFGGRLELAVSGAAPIEPEILSFFAAAGVPVMEGYGMTETAGIATLNTPAQQRLGTVGRPLPGCEVRIADDGEVLMRGPNIFAGYYRNEAATREDLADGWLHSGDLGQLEDGFLRITGRKKDLIITSSGKNITPSSIESSLGGHRWISRAVVFGDRRPYLTALITLDPDEAAALARKVGGPSADLAALAAHEGVRAEIDRLVQETNRNFARIEQVKRFELLDRDLSQERDELTPTLKIRRQAIYEQHAERFAGLYEG